LQNIAAAALRMGDKAAAQEAIQRLATVNPANPLLDGLRVNVAALP